MRIKIITGSIILFMMLFSCQSNQPMIDKTTVQKLNVEKYMGKWYEIARFQHPFERDLLGVTTTYKLRDDGKIDVTNAGYKNTLNGKYKEAS